MLRERTVAAIVLPLLLASCASLRSPRIETLVSLGEPDANQVRTVGFRTAFSGDTIDFGTARTRIGYVRYQNFDSAASRTTPMQIDVWMPVAESMRMNRAVILLHGYGALIESEYPLALAMVRRGYPCILVSNRGSNTNGGVQPSYGIYEIGDVTDAIDAFAQWTRQNADSMRIALFGESLGGVIGLNAAATERRIAGVALEGTMWDLRRAARQIIGEESIENLLADTDIPDGAKRFRDISPDVATDRFPRIPAMLIWGSQDSVVPPEERTRLVGSLRQRTPSADIVEIAGGGHSMRYGFPLQERAAIALNDRIADYLAGILAH